MKHILVILFVALLTGAGRVQTRDGKTIEGEIALADNAVVVHTSAAGDTRVAFDDITNLSLRFNAVPQIETAKAQTALPADWKSQDIGSVKFPGKTACDDKGNFTLTASGWGAWAGNDSCQFAGRTLEGDGQIIAHVAKLDAAQGPIVAGVMIRQSVAPDAPMATACLYASGEVRMNRRPTGPSKDFKHTDDAAAPQSWVRLTRAGDMLSAYRSADGKYWQQVDSRKVSMEKTIQIGITAWTTGNSWLSSAQIDSVRIVRGTPALSYFPGGDELAQGIVLRDGNTLAATITGLDDTGLHYVRAGAPAVMPIDQIARLIFSPVPPDLAAPGDKRGILLTSGDFIEGDVTGISVQPVEWPRKPQLKATVRSVLFGARNFETAKEVIALDLAPLAPAPAAYEVRTADGSVIRGKTVTIAKDAVTVDGNKVPDVVNVRKL